MCIISLSAPATIRFYRKREQGADQASSASLLLMPRSLFVFRDEAYTSCLHGILEVKEEQLDASVCNLHLCSTAERSLELGATFSRGDQARLSLTVRRVPRVIKGFVPLGRGK